VTRRRAALAVTVLAIGFLASAAGPAAAHASLVSVDPADGARLDESPDAVTLTFSEDVSVGLGGVRVLDGEGEPVQDGAARADGEVVTVDLRPDLPAGTYVVSYRVTSADGHPIRGGSVFGVGDVDVDRGALGRLDGGDDDRPWEVVGAVGRAIAYAGILFGAGGTAFLVLVHAGGTERARLVRLVRWSAAVGAGAATFALPVQAALGTGQGPMSLFDDGVLGEVARDGVGLTVVLAVLGAVLLVVAIERVPWLALLGAAMAAGSFASSGHTRAGDHVALATASDLSHLWVVAAWGGGLTLLWRTLHARRGEADPTGTIELVGRFSVLATASVVLVGLTGAALGWTQVGTLDALTSTTYGRLLLAKVALVAWVAALGAYNHFRLVPALTRGKATAALSQLWTTVRLEVLVAGLAVALTSVLVVVTPADTAARPGVVERMVALGDAGSVQVTVAPARAGFNQIHLYLFDPDGRPAEIAESLELRLSLPEAAVGPIARDAVRAGPAHFQLDSDDLAVAGTWSLEVVARVERFTEATGATEIPIAP
jgi:copper transport protein